MLARCVFGYEAYEAALRLRQLEKRALYAVQHY